MNTESPGQNSYLALNEGDDATIQATFSALTGLPASDVSLDNNASSVATALQQGKLVVLGTQTPVATNIVANHAYAVVGYNSSSNTPFTLFNPWGIYQTSRAGIVLANGAFLNQNFEYGVQAGSGNSGDVNSTGSDPTQNTEYTDSILTEVDTQTVPFFVISQTGAGPGNDAELNSSASLSPSMAGSSATSARSQQTPRTLTINPTPPRSWFRTAMTFPKETSLLAIVLGAGRASHESWIRILTVEKGHPRYFLMRPPH